MGRCCACSGGGLGDVLVRRLRERLRSLALGLLDVLAYCAQYRLVLLGNLRIGQPAVEVVGHQLLDTLPPEPHQEAALLEVYPLLGLPALSQCDLQRTSGRHQRVAVSGVGLQDLQTRCLQNPAPVLTPPSPLTTLLPSLVDSWMTVPLAVTRAAAAYGQREPEPDLSPLRHGCG